MAGNIPHISITSDGRNRAMELLTQSHYAGPAPVDSESYVEHVPQAERARREVHPRTSSAPSVTWSSTPICCANSAPPSTRVQRHLPLRPSPAPAKPPFAETLSRVLAEDSVWIPHAVEVDGQIITVYDPAIHQH
jgi:hypothetical protein